MKKWIFIFSVLVVIDFVLFGLLIVVSMTDEDPSSVSIFIGNVIEFLITKVMSFPMNIISTKYPFCVNCVDVQPSRVILLVFVNTFVQTCCLFYLTSIDDN